LSTSNLADDCVASAVPIIPIARRSRTLRKVRPVARPRRVRPPA